MREPAWKGEKEVREGKEETLSLQVGMSFVESSLSNLGDSRWRGRWTPQWGWEGKRENGVQNGRRKCGGGAEGE